MIVTRTRRKSNGRPTKTTRKVSTFQVHFPNPTLWCDSPRTEAMDGDRANDDKIAAGFPMIIGELELEEISSFILSRADFAASLNAIG